MGAVSAKNGLTEASPTDNFTFEQPYRIRYYIHKSAELSFAKIRNDYDLKSSWFSVNDNGREILLLGRGYGHGVGFSQEGAMEMDKAGYSYIDIIHYYFQNVELVENSNEF
ncbi:MAG: hypothetical protein HC896_05930 [Bacteroidales bacterium]|nr:hypothetical protein [Bacteroidales bacterium]